MDRKDYEVFAGKHSYFSENGISYSELFSSNAARFKDDKGLRYEDMKENAPEISKSSASRMINNQVPKKLDDIAELARELGISMFDLFTENEVHKYIVDMGLLETRDARWCLKH